MRPGTRGTTTVWVLVCAVSAATAGADDAACLGCHALIQKTIQGAAATGTAHPAVAMGCATCHVDHGANPAKGERYLKVSGSALCQTCHAGMLEKEFTHAPAKRDCTICHNPHGGTRASLRAESNGLCLECHSSTANSKFNEGSPVSLFGGQVNLPAGTFAGLPLLALNEDRGHPVSNHPVLRAADKTWPAVSCTGCHNPHGANNNPALLRNEEETFLLCLRCHQ